jgi:amino acid adenylation domain-containing protein
MLTIWDSVARQERVAPAATAVRGQRDISYRELVGRAEALAHEIQERAVPGEIIALDAASAPAAATALLAAARSRCPVLPLSAASPRARRAAILADAEPSLVLREDESGQLAIEPAPGGAAGGSPQPGMTAVAYVIYTSGSTGRPKGVVVPHEALRSRLTALSRVPGLTAGESILAMAAFEFDISMAELLLPLSVGGCFVAAPPEARLDPEIFAEVVRDYRPSVIQATPSFWRLALAWGWEGATAARLWSGGEALTPSLARALLPRCAQLWNVYGPSETTIWSAAALVTSGDAVHLGEPVPGARLCLEGDDGQLIGPGQPAREGEILIYGEGLATGYLNLPEMTARQFRVCRTPDGAVRCYRTGDRAHYSQDGTLRFLGRLDGQVKLRGHRVELGEIESVLEEHPQVHEAVAVVVGADHPDSAHIAAWLACGPGVTSRQVQAWLPDRLPASMRPARISIVAALPRTVTGKVDRVALAAKAAT